VASDRKQHPTLAAHVAEAAAAERELETVLAAHLLLVTRARHGARLERHLESAKARVERLEGRLKDLGASTRSVARPSRPAKQVRGAAKTAEKRAAKIASGGAKKVRDAGELRRVLEAARDEQRDALRQVSTLGALRAVARAAGDKETAKLAKTLRAEHRDWAGFLDDEVKALAKRLVRAEAEEAERAQAARRSSTAKRAASSGRGQRSGSRSGGGSRTRARSASTGSRSGSAGSRSGSSSSRSGSGTRSRSSSGRSGSRGRSGSGSRARSSSSRS